jgi:hypothetical protein
MKNNYNKFDKNINNDENLKNVARKETRDYSYYSRVLGKPFDSIEELKEAEAVYFAEQRAKADKAAAKKADAKKVEDAFVALNAARKAYKDDLTTLATEYSDALKDLKDAFELGKKDIHSKLAKAEDAYKAALKAFTDKYPEGYHLTLRDGDFETTISNTTTKGDSTAPTSFNSLAEIFEYLFS